MNSGLSAIIFKGVKPDSSVLVYAVLACNNGNPLPLKSALGKLFNTIELGI